MQFLQEQKRDELIQTWRREAKERVGHEPPQEPQQEKPTESQAALPSPAPGEVQHPAFSKEPTQAVEPTGIPDDDGFTPLASPEAENVALPDTDEERAVAMEEVSGHPPQLAKKIRDLKADIASLEGFGENNNGQLIKPLLGLGEACLAAGMYREAERVSRRALEISKSEHGEGHPQPETLSDVQWADYLFMRKNPKGMHREQWLHAGGCRRYFNVERDTVSYRISGSYKIGEQAPSEVAK